MNWSGAVVKICGVRWRVRTPESLQFVDAGIEAWMRSLPDDDADLVNANAGKPVCWVAGEGWVPGNE